MTRQSVPTDRVADGVHDRTLTADVLIIGGSLAGSWAALSARAAGARVIVAEKGYLGTAGVVAAATVGGRYLLPDDAKQRRDTISSRHDTAYGLDDLAFTERVYDQCYHAHQTLESLGYQPGTGIAPLQRRGFLGFPGATALRFFRQQLLKAEVRILDHSPALELLLTEGGAAAGAAGINRQTGETWAVRAGAVILATGGNAFLSGAIGTNGVTGDGYLMAAEAGAHFAGMEFSGHYGIAPVGNNCTKGYWYSSATFYDADRKEIERNGWGAVPDVAKAVMETGGAYASINRTDPSFPGLGRMGSPNLFRYFKHFGIDPYTERFPVALIYEGTVRAVGGVVIDADTATSVPGLYAAGDVTDRTKLTGASMSGAGPAVSWCLASGEWSGKNAAAFAAARNGRAAGRPLQAIGAAGLRPRRDAGQADASAIRAGIQAEILPIEKNVFRTVSGVRDSLARLDRLWEQSRDGLAGGTARDILQAREVAALGATARWIYSSALERKETRGLHRFKDHPELDPDQQHHVLNGGLDEIWVRTERPSIP